MATLVRSVVDIRREHMKSRLSFVILAFFFCAAFAFSEETAPTLDPDLVGEWVGTAPEIIERIIKSIMQQ
jgi:hypothetical protein